jgi:hypothetical protein
VRPRKKKGVLPWGLDMTGGLDFRGCGQPPRAGLLPVPRCRIQADGAWTAARSLWARLRASSMWAWHTPRRAGLQCVREVD